MTEEKTKPKNEERRKEEKTEMVSKARGQSKKRKERKP